MKHTESTAHPVSENGKRFFADCSAAIIYMFCIPCFFHSGSIFGGGCLDDNAIPVFTFVP